MSIHGQYIINDGKDQLNKNIQLENVEWYKEALEGVLSDVSPIHWHEKSRPFSSV